MPNRNKQDKIPPQDGFLTRLKADREMLLTAIDDLPEAALIEPNAVGDWSIIDLLAYIAAWDGETLRRIDFATGRSFQPPHDVDDHTYWQAWSKNQIKLKRIMGPRGIKVDMVGTWVRLLARLEELSSFEYQRWLEIDSRPQRNQQEQKFALQVQVWRTEWEQSLSRWHRWQYKILKKLEDLRKPSP